MQNRPGVRQIAADRATRLPWLAPPAGYIALIQDVAYGNRYKIARHQQLDRHQIKRGADFPFETRVVLIFEAENAAEAERDLQNELAAGSTLGDWFDLAQFPKTPPPPSIAPVSTGSQESVSLRDLVENDEGADSLLQDADIVATKGHVSHPRRSARPESSRARRRPRVARWAFALGLLVFVGVFAAERPGDIWRAIESILDAGRQQSISPTPPVAGRGEIFFTRISASVHSCEARSCRRVDSLSPGTKITAREYVRGQRISGSTRWIAFIHQDELRYIHDSLLSRTWPPAEPTPEPTKANNRSASPTPKIEGRDEVFFVKTRSRARSCANLSCRAVGFLSAGSKITARRFVSGQQVNGSARWIAFQYRGTLRYIHDSALIRSWPPVEPTSQPSPTAQPTRIKATAVGQGEVFYVRSRANARHCARISCEILDVVPPGTKITALRFIQGESIDGNDLWIRFSYYGRHLSIHSNNLTRTEPTVRPTHIQAAGAGQGKVFYVTSHANARHCARLSCEILDVVPPGTKITAFGFVQGESIDGNNRWIRFSYYGRQLSIHSSKLSRTDPNAAAFPTAPPSDSSAPSVIAGATFFTNQRASALKCAHVTCEVAVILPPGTPITATGYTVGQKIDGDERWVVLDHEGWSRFLHSSMLSTTPPPAALSTELSAAPRSTQLQQAEAARTQPLFVNERATVYKCANTGCQAIDQLERGVQIYPAGHWSGQRINGSNQWIRFRHKDTTVYLHSSYATEFEPIAERTEEPAPTRKPMRDESRSVTAGRFYTVKRGISAKVRNCAHSDCVEVGALPAGTQVQAARITRGQTVDGSNEWVMFHFEGWHRFVHSGDLVSATPLPAPSATQAAIDQPAATEARPTATFTSTEPPVPTATATVVSAAKYVVETAGNANAYIRACPRTSCEILAKYAPGRELEVIGKVAGETVYGIEVWYEISFEAGSAFIHSELATAERS